MRLTVGKGRSTENKDSGQWLKQYYECEVLVEDESQIELARDSAEGLIDIWLKGERVSQKQSVHVGWEPSKISWTKAEGSSGPYERSEDVNSQDFKALIKNLNEHKGKLQRDGLFYWLFENGSTVGRKPAKHFSKK